MSYFSQFQSPEHKSKARSKVAAVIRSVVARVAEDTEGVAVEGLQLTVEGFTRSKSRINFELYSDKRGIMHYGWKFTSIQITLDPWSGNSVRRAVKIDGTELPEGAEAKIEAKARELVEIAKERAASEKRRQEAADARKATAVAARRAAQAEGFEPRHQYTGAVVDLDAVLAQYRFGEKPERGVQVQHTSGSSRVVLDLSLPADEAGLMKALILAGNIQALVDEAGRAT